jgi:DNA-binding transcriptional ArsR family regulator
MQRYCFGQGLSSDWTRKRSSSFGALSQSLATAALRPRSSGFAMRDQGGEAVFDCFAQGFINAGWGGCAVEEVTMLSAVGFNAELVQRPLEELGATRLAILASPHERVQKTAKELQAWGRRTGVEVARWDLKRSYDFVEWHNAWIVARLTALGRPTFVNLTAGHAVAISTASIMAMKHKLPCVCYDDIEDEVHHLSPSILLRLDELIPRDRRALQLLAKGPRGVGDLVEQMEDSPSTVSRTLDRLESSGFLTVVPDAADNRRRVAELRPGVRAFLDTVLAP